MNIIKRNGMEVPFDRQKIVTAITKANETVNEEARLKPIYIEAIAQDVEEAVMAQHQCCPCGRHSGHGGFCIDETRAGRGNEI